MQARFWTYRNGAVRIKINAGQTLSHYSFARDEEGYSSELETYIFDGETITCHWARDGRDCDGRVSSSGESHCRVDQLDCGYFDQEENIRFPAWQNGESSQRDYSAEAMGY